MNEYLTIAALVGAGLNAGVFFSYSTFTGKSGPEFMFSANRSGALEW